MTQITVQDGKIVVRDGTVGTGQGCCCSSTDSGGGGACCLPDGTCESGLTQQECEECFPPNRCGTFHQDTACTDTLCCPFAGGGTGWFTGNYKQDFIALLEAAGYVEIEFNPIPLYDGSPVPFTDGCGQTYYSYVYKCCGKTGQFAACEPDFFIQTVRDSAGAGGNQYPPCVLYESDVFVWACCDEFP